MTDRIINLGVVGLGRAFSLMLPTFSRDKRFNLVAAATPGEQGRAAFERDLGGRAYADIQALCADAAVEAVYLASPHEFHCEHLLALAAAGKHCLVDKPLAISMAEARQIVTAVEQSGIKLVVGPSHSFDAPVLLARQIIDSGLIGPVRQIQSWYMTDFMYRPRRPAELDTGLGGGVLFSQGVHQVDVARLLAGGQARTVTALTGAWDEARAAEGAYSALLSFEGGVMASLSYNGYGYFDGDAMVGGVSELGFDKPVAPYISAKAQLRERIGDSEADSKRQRNLGYTDTHALQDRQPDHHEHFGLVMVSCDRGDLRLTVDGVEIYAADKRIIRLPPPEIPRREVMDEFYRVIVDDAVPLHDASWGAASLEVVIAMLESANNGVIVNLNRQVTLPTHWQSLYALTETDVESRLLPSDQPSR